MAKNSGQQDQPKKKRKGLKRLGAAFAAAAVIGGSGWTGWFIGQGDKPAPANDHPQSSHSVSVVSEPEAVSLASESDVVDAFNDSAAKEPEWSDPQSMFWRSMLHNQKEYMENPQYAQAYKEFLSKFDVLRGLPLVEQVKAVNDIVNDRTTYVLDDNSYGTPEYWAAPFETVVNRLGDCEDYAILEMAILRYLGVDEDRLYLAAVNSMGKTDSPPDHAILLVNVAPEGQAEKFLVMSNMKPVVPDNNEIIGKIWFFNVDENPNDNIPARMVPAKFIFVNARNLEGFWEVNPDMSKPLVPNGPKMVNNGDAAAPKLG